MMYCKTCGETIDSKMKFCANCGEKVEKKFTSFFIGGVVIILAVMIASIFLLKKDDVTQYESTVDRAFKYLEDEDFERAEAEFLSAIDVEPKKMELYEGLVNTYIGMEDEENLSKTYDEVIKLVEEEDIEQNELPKRSEKLYLDAVEYHQNRKNDSRTDEEKEEVNVAEEKEEVEEKEADHSEKLSVSGGRYPAFLQLVEEYIDTYGEFTYEEGEWETLYASGVSLVYLLDFNCDGEEELVVAYAENYDGANTEYAVEVWDYIDSELVKVYDEKADIEESGSRWVSFYVGDNEPSYMSYQVVGNKSTYEMFGYQAEVFTRDYAFEIGYGSSEVVFKYNDQVVSEEEWTEAGEMWQRFAFLEYTLIGDRTSVSTTLKCGTNGYRELIEKANNSEEIETEVMEETQDCVKIVVEWEGKDSNGNLINLDVTMSESIDATIPAGYLSSCDGEIYNMQKELVATYEENVTADKGMITYYIYDLEAMYMFEASDGNYLLDDSENNIFSAEATATVSYPDGKEYVFQSDEGLLRSYTGFWFWGICSVDDGNLTDYDDTWIRTVVEEQGLEGCY